MQQMDLVGNGQSKANYNTERLAERLRNHGYEVEQKVTLEGKSGAKHTFDMLARRSDGLVRQLVAVGVAAYDGQDITLGEVFTFDDMCYDCGIRAKVLVGLPVLESVAARFAESQRIKVFDKRGLEAFLESPPPTRHSRVMSSHYKTRIEFIESLRDSGYSVEETARVNGRSGAEYVFDILAEQDDGFVPDRIGVDAVGDGEVGLNQVSRFVTKAYDTGIYENALLASGPLSPEASQFAQKQGITIVKLGSQPWVTAAEDEIAQQPQVSHVQTAVEELLGKKAETRETKVLKRAVQAEALRLIPEATARRFHAMPVAIADNALQVAMANPADIFALQALGLQSRMRIKPIAAGEKEIQEAIDFNYRGFGEIEEQVSRIPTGGEATDVEDLVEATADAPVASALHLIIDEAVKARASDIHIEPEENRSRIRYRIDGALQDIMSLPPKIHLPLTSRIKIMAEMNIADRLHPQDGQFSTEAKGRLIDVRVGTSPTVHGEMTVLRLLDKAMAIIDLGRLGLSDTALAKYEKMLKVPFGMILISGPTGAGKTTTLYASVNTLDNKSRNIITIEDPVEYRFGNVNQIQVNPRAGVTFASGLRSILRLDPDVILVGEIRDAETARIAVQSALTGHLVLSSIHSNDAVGVIFRLLDLGVEPFLVSSAVIGVAAQRMVRLVCPHCATYREASLLEQLAYSNEVGETRAQFLYGSGCDLCNHTGYRGRTGIFEILPLSDNIRMKVLNHASTSEIREQAIAEGMVPLIRDGMLKAKAGITTPSEVLRNAYFIE